MQTCFILFIVVVAFVGSACASHCQKLREKYSPPVRYVSQHGVPKNITLYWDSHQSRAAVSLLEVILRHALGYQNVHLQQNPSSMPAETPCYDDDIFTEVNITVSAPPRLLLHLHLAKRFREKDVCANITDCSSHCFASECGLRDPTASIQNILVVNQLDFNHRKMRDTAACLEVSSQPFQFKKISRTNLFQMLQKGDRSFVFLDYDIWALHPDVNIRELPLNLKDPKCSNQELDAIIHTTVVKDCPIEDFAPHLFYILNKYSPSLKSIRPILEIESSHKDIEEIICKWVSNNTAIVNSLIGMYKPRKKTYKITSIVCKDEPGFNKLYDEILNYLGISREKMNNSIFFIEIGSLDLDCSNTDSVLQEIKNFLLYDIEPNHIGVVISNVRNITSIAKIVNRHDIPVLFYDTTDIDASAIKMIASDEYEVEDTSMTSIWISAGQSLHLTLALQAHIHSRGWTRVAVISEQTSRAKFFMENLIDLKGLALRNHIVGHNLTDLDSDKVLRYIKTENAHIIFVNTDYEKAVTILSAAMRLEMNTVEDYAWYIRERPYDIPLPIRHFVVTSWCKRGKDVLGTAGRLDYIEHLKEIIPHRWPPLAAALINAVLTLVDGFEDVILKYPQAQDDTLSKQVICQFGRSLSEVPVKGITQTLRYKMHMLEEAVVFVEEWHADDRKVLTQMRVNGTSHNVVLVYEEGILGGIYSGQSLPNDFASKCLAQTGDPYEPVCYDILGVITIVTLAMILIIVLQYKRTVYEAVNIAP